MTNTADGSSAVVATAEPDAPVPTPELRTFLFADVRGYTRFTHERGDEAAARLVSKFAALTREVVHARGGEVLELRGDEVLVVFNSARQALRAAVDLQARFTRETEADPSLPLPVGIGLDAGEAVPLDGGYRGEALNLAARLCNLAGPGQVLASEGVVYLGRTVKGVSYAEHGQLPIKGFADPVRVIRVVRGVDAAEHAEDGDTPALRIAASPTGRAEMDLPIGGFLGALPSGVLVGREKEWDRIMTSLQAVMQGTGRLVLLAGEPGIGKTRLAQEVTLKARHWGFLVATGRCYEPEQAVPYYPFLEALVCVYDAAHPSIRAEIPRRWPQLGRLLPDQIGFLPAASYPLGASGEDALEEQHLLFRAVTGFVEAVAETVPVALLLDDLHWADDTSLKLLQYLARYTHGQRVLLLGTYRDVEVNRQRPLEAALLDLSREQLVEEVEIRRLDHDGTAALIAEILGQKEDLDDLVKLIYRRTDGNAFFIQEVLHALSERGDLYRENGRWERRHAASGSASSIHEMEVPKSIRSVIGQRLSALEEQSQEILREASVLGQEFFFDDLLALGSLMLAKRPAGPFATAAPVGDTLVGAALVGAGPSAVPPVTGWTEDEVEAALEQAMVAGLVRETGRDTYAFNHALTQQALYAELSTRRRKRLHLAAGEALKRLPEAARERRAGELAWHFLEGDDAEQALHYAMLAGDRAAQVFANREAEQQYQTALELARELGDEAREVDALEKLAGILTTDARYDKALEMLEEAVELHRRAGDREGEACAVAHIGHVHYLRETPEEGIARLQPLVDAIEKESDGTPSYGLAALWAAVARLYVDAGKYKEQLQAAERAMELAGGLADHPGRARLLLGAEVTRNRALWGLGEVDDALEEMEDLIPRAEAAGDLDNLVRALGMAASYYARKGEFEKDRLYHLRMLEVAERRGDRGQIVLAAMALSTNTFLVGEWDQARVYLDRAEGIVRSLGTTHLSSWPVAARGWLLLRQGDLARAAEYAEEALSLGQSGEMGWRRHAERILAERDLLEGHPEAARRRLEPFLDQLGSKKDAGFLWTAAWIYLELGEWDLAHELSAQAIFRASMQNRQPELVEALTIAGKVAARADYESGAGEGRWAESERLLTEALSLATAMPFPFGAGRALYEFGLMLAQRGEPDAARERLTRALDVFQRLGAKKDAERTDLALAAL